MEEALFNKISSQLSNSHKDITLGKMMSSSGIQYKGKNFAFLYNKSMVFRLGRTFDIESEGIHKYELLNPFKNKPPLKDWFVVSYEYADKWLLLAKAALEKIKSKP